MERKDIEHLAKLARIAVTEAEADRLAADITGILGYIREIEDIAGTGAPEKKVGALYNVMREDGEPHPSGMYTEDLLNDAPKRYQDYVEVKKIIDQKK